MTHPSYDIVTTSLGAVSIRDNVTREIMHNPVGPWAEANALYIDQSRLKERLRTDRTEELVIFDVGLGAAANALAVLHAATGTNRPVRMISFERDLSLLEFALDHAGQFAHFAGYTGAVRTLLDAGTCGLNNLYWELRHGDFGDLITREATRANLVFHDPYSPTKNPGMWSAATFATVRAACAPDAELFTYSRATPVRVALLLAGFYVGSGSSSGLKDETTRAGVRRADVGGALTPDWLERWERSHAKLPPGAEAGTEARVREQLRAHPQFCAT